MHGTGKRKAGEDILTPALIQRHGVVAIVRLSHSFPSENTSNGKVYKTYYSVWFTEPHGLAEGDRVSLSGFLGAKIGEPWEDRDGNKRQSVELSVNNPRLSGGAEPAPVEAAPAWNSETPF